MRKINVAEIQWGGLPGFVTDNINSQEINETLLNGTQTQ